jgi:hypothetical protein
VFLPCLFDLKLLKLPVHELLDMMTIIDLALAELSSWLKGGNKEGELCGRASQLSLPNTTWLL